MGWDTCPRFTHIVWASAHEFVVCHSCCDCGLDVVIFSAKEHLALASCGNVCLLCLHTTYKHSDEPLSQTHSIHHRPDSSKSQSALSCRRIRLVWEFASEVFCNGRSLRHKVSHHLILGGPRRRPRLTVVTQTPSFAMIYSCRMSDLVP